MDRRNFLRNGCGALAALSGVAMSGCKPELRPVCVAPNILIITADDLGYNDVGYHGSDVATPNIDRIAREGLRLERNYCCPVCIPTRLGMMTGRYAHTTKWIMFPWMPTLPEVISTKYKNRAAFGKWHLGITPECHPLNRGFTEFRGMIEGSADYFSRTASASSLLAGQVDWWNGFDRDTADGYTTDLIADYACDFIFNADGPWFCCANFTAPHTPFHVPPISAHGTDWMAKYQGISTSDKPFRQKVAAAISYMDERIGDILETLESTGQRDNTIIYFMSDNGGDLRGSDNAPWLGGKNETTEGGVRTPAIVSWPDGLPMNQDVYDITAYVDVFPTVLAAAGIDMRGLGLVGRSIQETIVSGDAGRTVSYFNIDADYFRVIEWDSNNKVQRAKPLRSDVNNGKMLDQRFNVGPLGTINEKENLWGC